MRKETEKEKIIKRSERCVIEISRPYPVGSKGYLETFLKFVNYEFLGGNKKKTQEEK